MDQQNNKNFQFQSGLGKNIRDTFGKDLYAVCKTLSPTNSDELNLARKDVQTFPTCVLTFSPLKRMENSTQKVKSHFYNQFFHFGNNIFT